MSVIDRIYNVERTDTDLYVEQAGPEDAPVLYFLHGGPGYSSHSFRDLLGSDLDAYRMIYPDQRGGGRSWTENQFGLQELADDVRAICTALELPPVTLLAHGFGALTAVQAAVDHPKVVSGIVFVNPWFSMPLLAGTLHRTAAQLAEYPEPAEGTELTVDELIDEAFSWTPAHRIFEHLQFPRPQARLQLEHSDSSALLGPADTGEFAEPWQADVLPLLTKLEQQVVLMAGQHDGTVLPDQAEAALLQLPQALFTLISGGHYPWLDDPDMFLDLLQQGLEAVQEQDRP